MKISKKQIKAVLPVIILAGVFIAAGIIIEIMGRTDEETVNMVLCLDDSGSMVSKQEMRDKAAVDLVTELKDSVNFGGLYFQYNVTKAIDIQSLRKSSARTERIEMFCEQHEDDRGNTNSGEALLEALSMIEESNRRAEAENKAGESIIILFTDGKNDFLNQQGERVYSYIEEADHKTKKAMKKAKKMDVTIHTICLNENDIELLQQVSRETGGSYTRIDTIEELPDNLLWVADAYTKKRPGGKTGMEVFILLIIGGVGAVAFYYFQNFKKQEYLMDYQVDMMKDEIDQRNKREELDNQIREEQKNKKFYQDIIITHGNAIGGRSCFDNEGKRRGGILSIGDIVMIGRNVRGEDYTYRIEEAGMELWATFDEDELILRSKKTPFEIRKEGTARDQGDRTQKAIIKSGQQYYIVLGTKHEIGLQAVRGR